MNVLKAAYAVVHEFPGGARALVKRLSTPKSSTQLCHEVDPPEGSKAKLGMLTAVEITEITNDDRMLIAWAESRGYACVPVKTQKRHADLLGAVCFFSKETADALLAMHQAIVDGRITENEIHHFEKQVADIAPAAIALERAMREKAMEQSKARAVAPAPYQHFKNRAGCLAA